MNKKTECSPILTWAQIWTPKNNRQFRSSLIWKILYRFKVTTNLQILLRNNLNSCPMVINMKARSWTESSKALESTLGPIKMFMKVNGLTIKRMDKVSSYIQRRLIKCQRGLLHRPMGRWLLARPRTANLEKRR